VKKRLVAVIGDGGLQVSTTQPGGTPFRKHFTTNATVS
jgi:hypothetical protein